MPAYYCCLVISHSIDYVISDWQKLGAIWWLATLLQDTGDVRHRGLELAEHEKPSSLEALFFKIPSSLHFIYSALIGYSFSPYRRA